MATTPSTCSARVVSMFLRRACGYDEWRILPISMPGALRSSVYLPAPVVFSAASTIAVGLPIMEKLWLMYLVIQHSELFPAKRGICFPRTAHDHLAEAIPSRSAAIADRIAS